LTTLKTKKTVETTVTREVIERKGGSQEKGDSVSFQDDESETVVTMMQSGGT